MTEEFKGQPIGVKDKNGRPICEGYRVRSEFMGKIGTIVYRPGRFVLRFDDGMEMTFMDENSNRLSVQEENPPGGFNIKPILTACPKCKTIFNARKHQIDSQSEKMIKGRKA